MEWVITANIYCRANDRHLQLTTICEKRNRIKGKYHFANVVGRLLLLRHRPLKRGTVKRHIFTKTATRSFGVQTIQGKWNY